MSWLKDLGSSLVGNILGQGVSSAFGKYNASQSAQLQYEYQKRLWEYQQSNAHQLEVKDLQAAGLNPILSATNSQIASTPNISAPIASSGASDINNAVVQRAQIRVAEKNADTERISAEAQRLSSDADSANARTNEYNAKTAFLKAMSDIDVNDSNIEFLRRQGIYVEAQTATEQARQEQIRQDIVNSTRHIEAVIRNLDSSTALNSSQINKVVAEIAEISERTLGYKADRESEVKKLQNMTAEQQRNYLSTWFGEFSHMFGYGLGLVNPFTGFGVSSTGNFGGTIRK